MDSSKKCTLPRSSPFCDMTQTRTYPQCPYRSIHLCEFGFLALSLWHCCDNKSRCDVWSRSAIASSPPRTDRELSRVTHPVLSFFSFFWLVFVNSLSNVDFVLPPLLLFFLFLAGSVTGMFVRGLCQVTRRAQDAKFRQLRGILCSEQSGKRKRGPEQFKFMPNKTFN